MLDNVNLQHVASATTGLGTGVATMMGFLPIIAGVAVSIVSIVWIYIQYKWAKADREKEGKQ